MADCVIFCHAVGGCINFVEMTEIIDVFNGNIIIIDAKFFIFFKNFIGNRLLTLKIKLKSYNIGIAL